MWFFFVYNSKCPWTSLRKLLNKNGLNDSHTEDLVLLLRKGFLLGDGVKKRAKQHILSFQIWLESHLRENNLRKYVKQAFFCWIIWLVLPPETTVLNIKLDTVKPLNNGHLRVLKKLSFTERCPLLGSNLKKIVTFGTQRFVHCSWNVR